MNELELRQLRDEVKVLKKRLDRIVSAMEEPSFNGPPLFAVELVTDGGSAGSATVECSYTYTVKDKKGLVLGEDVELSTSRHIVAAMNAATHGIAWMTPAGQVILWWCDEQEQTEICT